MVKKRDAYRVLVGISRGKKLLEKECSRIEDNVETNL